MESVQKKVNLETIWIKGIQPNRKHHIYIGEETRLYIKLKVFPKDPEENLQQRAIIEKISITIPTPITTRTKVTTAITNPNPITSIKVKSRRNARLSGKKYKKMSILFNY